MQQLRRQGQLHTSMEVGQVASLVTGFVMLSLIWSWFMSDMKLVFLKAFGMIAKREPITATHLLDGFRGLLMLLAPELLSIMGAVGLVACAATMLQTNWNVKEKLIDPRFSMLNPINGVKRIFSINGLVMTLKAIVKLLIIVPIAYFALREFAPQMVKLIHMNVQQVLSFTGTAIRALFWKVAYILIVMAVIDYAWTRYEWFKRNKMTKNEVKDEHKSVEGDEQTKRQIQAKGLKRIMQRIAHTVPKADVVVTNPTHFAVALRYDRGNMEAPIVVAKGQDHLALRIREIARQSGVPVLERKALARSLYQSTEVGATIPRELFKAVAEVLAYVYRLKNPFKRAAQ